MGSECVRNRLGMVRNGLIRKGLGRGYEGVGNG